MVQALSSEFCKNLENPFSQLYLILLTYRFGENLFPHKGSGFEELDSTPINVDSRDIILTWIHESLKRKYNNQFDKTFQSSSSYSKFLQLLLKKSSNSQKLLWTCLSFLAMCDCLLPLQDTLYTFKISASIHGMKLNLVLQ